MAMIGTTELGLKKYGTTVSVPGDPRAKLMYYLKCVSGLLDMDDDADIRRLGNYRNYQNIGQDDVRRIWQMCLLLSPDILDGKCMFQIDRMCGDQLGQFYELSEVRNNMVVAGNVLIGGRRRRVTKILAYKRQWLRQNYTEPMERLKNEGCIIL